MISVHFFWANWGSYTQELLFFLALVVGEWARKGEGGRDCVRVCVPWKLVHIICVDIWWWPEVLVLRTVHVIVKATKITISLFLNFFTMVVRVFQPSKRAASIPDCVLLIFLKRVHPNNKTAWLYLSSLNFLRASMLGFVLWMSY